MKDRNGEENISITSSNWENQRHTSASFFRFLVFLFQSRFYESFFGDMEMKLEKPKEVFV
jgi:hypothetical protein